MSLRTQEPESCASASSATPAYFLLPDYNTTKDRFCQGVFEKKLKDTPRRSRVFHPDRYNVSGTASSTQQLFVTRKKRPAGSRALTGYFERLLKYGMILAAAFVIFSSFMNVSILYATSMCASCGSPRNSVISPEYTLISRTTRS